MMIPGRPVTFTLEDAMRYLSPILLVFGMSTASADDASQLADYLPGSANTVAIVRVSSIFGTQRAQAEHWYEQQEERFQSGVAAIPPWVDTLVIGSLVHPSVPEEVWSAAVVRRPNIVTIEAIAEHEGTSVEDLAGSPAVRSRRDSYLVQPVPNLLTAYRPAHRLEASRWARSVSEQEALSLSSYLRQAANDEGHVVLAMDIRDLLDPQRVEQHLLEDERFASHRKLIERLIPLVSGLRGITFSATITDRTQATISIDFSDDVGPSALSIKTLFVSILDDLGAAIDEFADAKVTSRGQSVVMTCPLSDGSLRRILSLIVTPSTPYHAPPKATADSAASTPSTRAADPQKATRRYLESIDKMIDDLRRANRRAKDYSRTAAWHDNFARKILDLPTEHVDPKAVEYGDWIASSFRALGASLRGQGVEVNTQQKTLTYDVDYKPGWAAVNIWGGVGYREPSYNVKSNLRDVREKQAAAVSKGAQEREQIWTMIEDEQTAIMRTLD